ncbi:unnamed protein product [Effrenium voratum]|nr:unnamed protein product [Effrenium voratum]
MALSPAFVAPMAGAWSLPSAPSRSRIGSRREPQRLYTAAAATSAACVTHLRRKVQRRAGAEDGLALVLRSKLQELAKTSPAQRAAQRWQDLGEAKVLMPENSIPWGVTHFIGGAVLGQFPELCYSSLLQPFVDKTGMAVICTPYELGRDHMGLAELVSANFAEALQLAQQRFGWAVASCSPIGASALPG